MNNDFLEIMIFKNSSLFLKQATKNKYYSSTTSSGTTSTEQEQEDCGSSFWRLASFFESRTLYSLMNPRSMIEK